jgi:adenylate kinase
VVDAPKVRAVMLGAPGSGKGTQAELLARMLYVPAISTGEMLRQAVAEKSDLGERVKGTMASGALVDDELMSEVVRRRLERDDAESGFLLDGYPRTTAQAATLDSLLEDQGLKLDAVVLLDVPEPVLVQRATARRRADDAESVVRERLRVYREKTEPLVEHYSTRGLLRRVNGDREIGDVTASILKALRG